MPVAARRCFAFSRVKSRPTNDKEKASFLEDAFSFCQEGFDRGKGKNYDRGNMPERRLGKEGLWLKSIQSVTSRG